MSFKSEAYNSNGKKLIQKENTILIKEYEDYTYRQIGPVASIFS